MTTAWSVQARWVVPGDGRILADGIVRGRDEIIEAVGRVGKLAPAAGHRVLPRAVILPGLVNAHTHLELSHLRGRLPRGASMSRWIFALMRRRGSSRRLPEAVAAGACEALGTGTTAVADISHDNGSWRVLRNFPLRKLCLAERMGFGPFRGGDPAGFAARLDALPPSDDGLKFGLAPHAPYSTSARLYREAAALARERAWPLATHLAETRGERKLLMAGGRALTALRGAGLGAPFWPWPGCKPVEFARRVGFLEPSSVPVLLAHVNYIDDDELSLLAASDASVVYCPGSSAFFGRSGHRYPDMLAAGINVAVGTDSLASNDSLDMFAEMRRLKRQGRVDNPTILRMATLGGARALGWQDRIGSLEPGKDADWVAVEEPASERREGVSWTGRPGPRSELIQESDVLEAILTQPCPVIETVIGGRVAFPRRLPGPRD